MCSPKCRLLSVQQPLNDIKGFFHNRIRFDRTRLLWAERHQFSTFQRFFQVKLTLFNDIFQRLGDNFVSFHFRKNNVFVALFLGRLSAA